MCNVSSSFSFFPIHRCLDSLLFFFHQRDAFSFLVSTHYRFSSPVIHMLELGLDLISTCIFPLARPVPYGLHCSTTTALAFLGKKALCERARPANECNFTIFDFTFNFFLCCVFFFISPCMLLETVCAVLMHICTHKEMSLFFYPIQLRDEEAHKKVCSTRFFPLFRCSMALFKGFFICFPCSLIDIIMHRLWLWPQKIVENRPLLFPHTSD